MQPPCRHCSVINPPHTRTCVCGYIHNDHVDFGPCFNCKCERYDQRKLVKQVENETSYKSNQKVDS